MGKYYCMIKATDCPSFNKEDGSCILSKPCILKIEKHKKHFIVTSLGLLDLENQIIVAENKSEIKRYFRYLDEDEIEYTVYEPED